MAAPNGQALSPHPQSDAANEPSMEDILASIRRIIASDQTVGSGRTFLSPPQGDKAANADLELTAIETSEAASSEPGASALDDMVESPEHPGDLPGLRDLDALVLPPAQIDDIVSGGDHHETPGRHGLSSLQDRLFPPVEETTDDPVFELRDTDRVSIDPEPLISSSVGASISSSFKALADSMLLRDPEMLDRIAREALRPMLKSWLDENLPSMVERLVRAEIERVARGGRNRD